MRAPMLRAIGREREELGASSLRLYIRRETRENTFPLGVVRAIGSGAGDWERCGRFLGASINLAFGFLVTEKVTDLAKCFYGRTV